MKFKKRESRITVSEKTEITIEERGGEAEREKSSSFALTAVGAILAFVAILVLIIYSSYSKAETDLSTLPSIESNIYEATILGKYLNESGLVDSTKETVPEKIAKEVIPEGTKVIQYFHQLADPHPFLLQFFIDHQTVYELKMKEDSYEMDKSVIEKKVNYIAKRWVLTEDMLEIITQDSVRIPFKRDQLWQIEDILSWSIGLRNLRAGDVVSWVVEQHVYPLDNHVDNLGIVGLLLNSQSLDTTLYAIKFSRPGEEEQFYDYTARPWKRQFLSSPVIYGRISSRYNLVRLHPRLKKIKAHRGTDFAAPEGVEIYALANGEIIEMEHKSGNGNYVKLKHDEIYTTAYLHMHSFNDNLKVGDQVRQGQLIGYVGSTGLSTGPHVCLRFWRRNYQDDFISAFPYLPTSAALPYEQRILFEERREKIIELTSELADRDDNIN